MRRFDGLGDQLAAVLDADDAILDGEVIAADVTGRPQFYDLLRRVRAPAYVAFDMLWADGTGIVTLALFLGWHFTRATKRGADAATYGLLWPEAGTRVLRWPAVSPPSSARRTPTPCWTSPASCAC